MRPKLDGILETAVYVDDMETAHSFYSEILGLKRMVAGERLFAYDAGPAQALLVFIAAIPGRTLRRREVSFPGTIRRGTVISRFALGPTNWNLAGLPGRDGSGNCQRGRMASRRHQPLFQRPGRQCPGAGGSPALAELPIVILNSFAAG